MNTTTTHGVSQAIRMAYEDVLDVIHRLPDQPDSPAKEQLKADASEYITALITAVIACDGDFEEDEQIFLCSTFNITNDASESVPILTSYVEKWNSIGGQIPAFIQHIAKQEGGQDDVYEILRMLQTIANNIAILDGDYEQSEITLIRDLIIRVEAYLDGSPESAEKASLNDYQGALDLSTAELAAIRDDGSSGSFENAEDAARYSWDLISATYKSHGDFYHCAKKISYRVGSLLQGKEFIDHLANMWGWLVDFAFEDHLITEDEEERINQMAHAFSLPSELLDKKGKLSRLAKAAVLRDLKNGIVKSRVSIDEDLPFKLQKTEAILWMFPKVKLYEIITKRSVVGGSTGTSIRIAKGLYWRLGGFKAVPQAKHNQELTGEGTLVATNKHLMFSGQSRNFRIPYTKIATIHPSKDSIEVQRDAASAKPQVFEGLDGQFIYNLVMFA